MKYNASDVMLSVYDGAPATKKLIAEQTKCSLKLSTNLIDVTSKQNGGWQEELGGLQSGELTVEFFDDTAPGPDEVNEAKLNEIWAARARPKWALESTLVGALNREFFGIITSLDLGRDMESGASGTMTIKITQKPTTTVVA